MKERKIRIKIRIKIKSKRSIEKHRAKA